MVAYRGYSVDLLSQLIIHVGGYRILSGVEKFILDLGPGAVTGRVISKTAHKCDHMAAYIHGEGLSCGCPEQYYFGSISAPKIGTLIAPCIATHGPPRQCWACSRETEAGMRAVGPCFVHGIYLNQPKPAI